MIMVRVIPWLYYCIFLSVNGFYNFEFVFFNFNKFIRKVSLKNHIIRLFEIDNAINLLIPIYLFYIAVIEEEENPIKLSLK